MSKGPKFNKNKCMKCKYHGVGVGYPVGRGRNITLVHCNYTNNDRGSVLRAISPYETYDLRGTDYNNCLLFEEGKSDDGLLR